MLKKIMAGVMLVSILLLSGCYTRMAVQEENYWAVPIAVPVDIVLLPGQLLGELFLMSMFGGWEN